MTPKDDTARGWATAWLTPPRVIVAGAISVLVVLGVEYTRWSGSPDIAPLAPPADAARANPEAAAPGTAGTAETVRADRYMIAAANPHAAEAGRLILAEGGTAVDAAIAAQAVLGVVEPQSSGIGGGGFLVHFHAATGRVTAYDGRETAPAATRPSQFLDAQGEPLGFFEAVTSGLSVGVPGLVAMLELAHADHGRLPWWRLFAPAIGLAEEGFQVSPRLNRLLAGDRFLRDDPGARALYYDLDGQALAVGAILRNPHLAGVYGRIAKGGAGALRTGPVAEAIVAAVTARGGAMTLADLQDYRAVRRDPVCAPYRRWRVCGMPPPTSGGTTVLQMLGLLERFDLAALAPGRDGALPVSAAHLLAEAGRVAFADRNAYLGDPDFVDVPVGYLLAPDYLAGRAAMISTRDVATDVGPGLGDGGAPATPPDGGETTHLSVVDAEGNAVALTSSIENAFGARILVEGFLLNNQLTDFDFRPTRNGRPVANRAEAGKRPRSSMAPTIVLDARGRPRLVTGSPGGSRIIGYVAKSIVAALDWDLPPGRIVALPHVTNRGRVTTVERDTGLAARAEVLRALGHEVRVAPMTSGVHLIDLGGESLAGAADPRREGVVLGE